MYLENKLKTKRARLLELGSKIASLSNSEKSEFKKLAVEIETLSDAVSVAKLSKLPVNGKTSNSPAGALVNSTEYKQAITKWNRGINTSIDGVSVDFKTLLTNTGMATTSVRSNFVEYTALQIPTIIDLFATITINQPSYLYLEETTFTNNGDSVAEGAEKPEAAVAYTERSVIARKMAVHIPVTSEVLADVANAESIINDRLLTMFRRIVEDKIINGSGTAPHMRGLLNTTGAQTHTLGADTVIDAIKKMITKVETVGFAAPNAVLMNPNQWESIVLSKDAEDRYYFSGPVNTDTKTIWGLPVITSTDIPADKIMVLDTTQFALVLRQDATFSVGVINDDFTKNIQRILVEGRMALAAHRPSGLVICDTAP